MAVIPITIRERIEMDEERLLDEKATLSKNSRGRATPEIESEIRTAFQRDRDRIIHSKAFRRLKHKTQVFISPEQDHYRTRLTHTLEVSQIGRTIARALRLNEDLVEAISLGHDLGHTPFGHSGEAVLDELHPNGFRHNDQSLRVVTLIEQRNSGMGLNLTYEVLDGIKNHGGNNIASTEEGKLIKYADRIAYINHDIDDAVRAGVINVDDIPRELLNILGFTHSRRIDTLIKDLIYNTLDTGNLSMSPRIEDAMIQLREYMFKNVYLNAKVKSEESKIKNIISNLYNYYAEDLQRIPSAHLDIYDGIETTDEDIVCDYIASMTDTYVVHIWKDIFEPKKWS